jgi:hypothetical protein
MNVKQVDLLGLVSRDTRLRKVANTRGGEYAGACPQCKGHDRFHVQPVYGLWACRQCHPNWSDAIEYIRWRDGVGFKQAVEILGLPLEKQNRIVTSNRPAMPENAPHALGNDYIALNDPDWQENARLFAGASYDALWSAQGAKALFYLKNRGISEDVISKAGLGYNPEDVHTTWGLTEVWLPRGIVIPWVIEDKFWRLNIRRPTGEPKYIGVKGNANGLYNAGAIKRDTVVVMTEGEFDSLVIRSTVKGIIPVATGTVAWARVLRWVSLLSLAYQVVIAFDADETENNNVALAVQWWKEQLGDKAIRLVPTEHDVTDMYKAGKCVANWLKSFDLSVAGEMDLEYRQQIRDEMISKGYIYRSAA